MYKPFLDALDLLEETGSADEVFRQIQQIDNASQRESTLKMLAKYFAREGNVSQAQRFTAAIHDETTSIYCLQGVARELRRKGYSNAASGFLQRAYEKARGLKASDPGTAFIWLVVSIELHDAGRLRDALAILHRAIELLQQSSEETGGAKLLLGCSVRLGKWGYPEEARAVAESIHDDRYRKYALDQLA